MLAPAIVACFIYSPYDELTFIASMDYKAYRPISQTFNIMFGESWKFVWPVVLIGILQVVASSLIMSAVDRHFRTGKLSLRSPIRLLNYSIAPIAISVAVMCVTAVILRFALFGLVTLVQVSFRAMGANESFAFAVICVLAVAVFIAHIVIITPMLFWAPSMFIYGYKFRDAAASSIKLMSGKKMYRGLVFPLLILAVVQLIFAFLDLHVSVTYIVGFVIFLVTNVYVVAYVIVSFYKISGLDRRDIMPYRVPLPPAPPQPEPEPASAPTDKPKKSEKSPADKPKKADKKSDSTDKKQGGKKSAKKSKSAGNTTTAKKSTDKKSGAKKSAAKKSTGKKKSKPTETVTAEAATETVAGEEDGDVV